jgi:hypothetical protein
MVHNPYLMAYIIWCMICVLFLDNANPHVIYVLLDFHNLFQGELSINDYFNCLKHIVDLMCDVGHPMSYSTMVINDWRGLNYKFIHAISMLTACKTLSTFLFTWDSLLQEEDIQLHTVKMEAASAIATAMSSA